MKPSPDLVFLDTETTGLSPSRHEIIDIWAQRRRWGTLELVAEAGGLVEPAAIQRAEPRALRVNGFDSARWAAEARSWGAVWLEVEPLLEGYVTVVGSNPCFDLRFIEAQIYRTTCRSWAWPRYIIDTAAIATPLRWQGLVTSCSLGALCEHLGVGAEDAAHSARGDVLRTVEVFRRLVGGAGGAG